MMHRILLLLILSSATVSQAQTFDLYLACEGTLDIQGKQIPHKLELGLATGDRKAKLERNTFGFRNGRDFEMETTPRTYFVSDASMGDVINLTIDRQSGNLTGTHRLLSGTKETTRFQFECKRQNANSLPPPKF